MIQNVETDRLIERYLLGDLPQLEREQVEMRYFAEPDFLEQVDAVERDLIEDYVLDMLSQEKRRRVEEHLLRSPYQWEKVQFTETLLHSVDEVANVAETDALVIPPPQRTSRWATVLNSFRLQPGWVLATSAVLLLLTGALVVEIIRLRLQLERAWQKQLALQQRAQVQEDMIAEQRNRIERLTGQPQVPVPDKRDDRKDERIPAPLKPQFATFISPMLFSGARATEKIPELTISRNIETVRLRLVYDGQPHARFRAVLGDGNDKEFWQKGGWTAQKFGRRQKVEVEIPVHFFEERIYTLTLKARTESGEEESVSLYTFQVTRP